ncbi:transposable element Tcb2 transposase [Trichonephila clavipes]|nr:transposable element Tcb2 transposase [Trichonephila clavipes]
MISGSQSHRACMGFLGRRLAARTLPPVTIRELRLVLQDEWAAMPQQLIDTLILSTLILSMDRRCETCLAPLIRKFFREASGRERGALLTPENRAHPKGLELHRGLTTLKLVVKPQPNCTVTYEVLKATAIHKHTTSSLPL